MFKVCIISCGMITNNAHIPAYKNRSDVFEIVAVCDVNEVAAKNTAKRHNIKNWYTDAEAMLREQKPDVVSVCVPNMLHKKFTLLALSYGANVICEKPVATTYKDALEMYNFAKKQGKFLVACQSMRFTPDRLMAKKLIDEGKIGKIYYGELSRIRQRGIPTWGKFHIKEVSGGGAFIDIGVHMLDALVWLMGNPKLKSVCATNGQYHKDELGSLKASGALTGNVHTKRQFNPDEMNVESFSSGSISFENGARINFKVAWATNQSEETLIRLVGEKSGIDLPDGKMYFGADKTERLELLENKYPNEDFSGHFYLIDNIADVLLNRAELIIKPEESITVAAIIDCAYKSAETGMEVSFDD